MSLIAGGCWRRELDANNGVWCRRPWMSHPLYGYVYSTRTCMPALFLPSLWFFFFFLLPSVVSLLSLRSRSRIRYHSVRLWCCCTSEFFFFLFVLSSKPISRADRPQLIDSLNLPACPIRFAESHGGWEGPKASSHRWRGSEVCSEHPRLLVLVYSVVVPVLPTSGSFSYA